MTQLAIDLPFQPALGAADFLVSESNRAAFAWVERWPDWPGRALVLYGPVQCGKSHLARLWSARSAGRLVHGPALHGLSPPELAALPCIAIDDADAAPERVLLHIYNCCRETGSFLLIVARKPPSRWPTALPDLASRLRAMPVVGIDPPDDALLAGLLVKHFADRQIRVAPSVVGFAVRRIERSFAAAAAFVGALDRAALGAGRPIGIALVRRVLAEIGAQPEPRSDLGVT
jgi:chromosomal replication initiation ATPase DnaA